MGQPIARGSGTDSINTNHGCDATTVTDQCSTNVFFNGKGAVRNGDASAVHNVPSGDSCVPHIVYLSTNSSTVFVNSLGIGRLNDSYNGETISSGSLNIYSG